MAELSWTPIRRGSVFCSSACGFGCTKAQYDARMRDGVRIAKQLGPGWKGEVHENMGWHLSIYSPCRRIRVGVQYDHSDRIVDYFAFLNHALVGVGETPQAAIDDVISKAQAARDEINRILDGLED